MSNPETKTTSRCWHCDAPFLSPCAHPDPCPAWEDFKDDHPEYQETES